MRTAAGAGDGADRNAAGERGDGGSGMGRSCGCGI